MFNNHKITLEIQYNDGKIVAQKFETVDDAAELFRINYLRYAIGCIIFADDMSEFESLDLNAYFDDIIEENDKETFEKIGEHIALWKKSFTDSPDTFEECVTVFNQKYSKELNGCPLFKTYH